MNSLLHRDLKLEFMRRKSRRESMLMAFKRQGELTTKDLLHFGPGLSSRLHELRKDYKIMTMYEKPGEYRYIFMGLIEDDGTNLSVID